MTQQELKTKLLETNYFEDNEWLDKYCELIFKKALPKKIKKQSQEHHIFPKCYFEITKENIDESKENKVNLLYKDHLLAHYYLVKSCSYKKLQKKLNTAFIKMTFRKSQLKDFNPTQLDGYQEMYENFCEYLSIINKNNFINFYNSGDNEKIQKCLERKSKSGKNFYLNLDPKEKELRDLKRITAIRNMGKDKQVQRNLKIKYKKLNLSEKEKEELGEKINSSRGWDSFNKVVERIPKNILYSYYIEENHSKKETEKYFNISDSRLDKLLRYYNIYKFSPRMVKRNEIQKDIENFKYLYLDLNYTIKELCNYYNCKEGIISKIIKDNNINKNYKSKYKSSKKQKEVILNKNA